jgi:hypothetical protein
MDGDEYRKKIEKEILKIIEEKLIAGEMKAPRAREIAQLVLDKLHPGMTLEEIYQTVPLLDDNFSELASVVLPVVTEYEEKITQIVLQHVEKLIKQGKIEEANMLMEKAKNKTIPLK